MIKIKESTIKKYFLGALFFLHKFVDPKSKDEAKRRREFILNILLAASISLYTISFIFSLYNKFFVPNYDGINPLAILAIDVLFILIYLLSRFKSPAVSSYLFTTSFYIPTVYAAYRWGTDLPVVLLFSVLVIIMSGILINTKASFIISALVIFSSFALSKLQIKGNIIIDRSWKNGEPLDMNDMVMYSIIFVFIAIISWLSNKETEKSLKRAKQSETDLKKQKDSLEIIVEERTKELQKTQMEKMEQIYNLADIGKLSSGLFHDLISPLNALSINIEKIKSSRAQMDIQEIDDDIGRALKVTDKMKNLIGTIQKQTSEKESSELFLLNQEINDAIEVLKYRIRKNKINISFNPEKDIRAYGSPIKFNQVVMNLLNNAIDSYLTKGSEEEKTISINTAIKDEHIKFTVADRGSGIDENILDKIFNAFFTTKNFKRDKDSGAGIGLYLCKRIIEKDFNGEIKAYNRKGNGAIFIIKLPLAK